MSLSGCLLMTHSDISSIPVTREVDATSQKLRELFFSGASIQKNVLTACPILTSKFQR